MSRIEKMIAELCPEGVEFKELQELFFTKNGYTPSTNNQSYWADGTIPWFRMEDIRENGRILSESLRKISKGAVKSGKLFPAYSIIIATSATIGEHALVTVPHLSNQRFTSLTLKPNFSEQLDMKFVFYYCFLLGEWCRKNITKSSFASVDMSGFKKFCFPIPPLKIQHKIIQILDAFDRTIIELKSKLKSEHIARKKQYLYYRDQLLSFSVSEVNVEWKTLGELGHFIRGKRFTKKDYVEKGVDVIHYGEIYTRYGVWTTHAHSQVRDDMEASLRYAEPGDVVITGVGETVEDVGKAVAWLGNDRVAIHDDSYAFRHSMNAKYISYAMQTTAFIDEKAKHVSRGKVNRLSANGIKKIRIPIPYPNDPEKSLAEQARIVAILDKFDVLINSISQDLPREIELRQQQYEYYRDLLLSFPRSEAAV